MSFAGEPTGAAVSQSDPRPHHILDSSPRRDAGRSALSARERHTLEITAACATALVPWIVVLARSLPTSHAVRHWGATWVGFDGLLFAALAATAFLGWRRRPGVVHAALATAVLLVCDAWFDVSLDFGTADVWSSAALALFVELPLAAYLFRQATRYSHRFAQNAPGSADKPGAADRSRTTPSSGGTPAAVRRRTD